MSKCCQYAIDDYNVCVGLISISIKETHVIVTYKSLTLLQVQMCMSNVTRLFGT
jgi:hypothetical protein